MKCSIALSLFLLAICAYQVSTQSHNVTFGTIRANDTLLDRELVVKKYKLLQIVSDDYEYPRKGYYNSFNITGIRCTDQYTNGDGGNATLLKGGPGANEVKLHLKSKRNHGFKFVIEVYGRA
ncbi:unnamed protein product [Hermetia illucens]|uniref:Salivary secreted peptide n=1 Tax=Hermetia illucens TaxID=343691 RepID=A0A7R8USM3_HERIL|nr:probable salivary secreted peptide [Hermetia illucens]XP_037911308.1 probable salivary secreted peptide [Hermetia illucens]CAD7086231.1 unnamed protein product [Hermetia illucens]CAD7086233.1 unnamed protein product [Hermetia illucens]